MTENNNNQHMEEYEFNIPSATILFIEPKRLCIKQTENLKIFMKHISRPETEKIQPNIEYYSAIESDQHRLINRNFGRIKDNQSHKGQRITLTRTENTQYNQKSLTIYTLPIDASEDLVTSYYTKLTQEIGITSDGKKINFYVNPMHIAQSMEYCRPPNLVYWADIPKCDFDGKTYDECVNFLSERNTLLEKQAANLLRMSYQHKSFDTNDFHPVMHLDCGGFGYVLLVLARFEKRITTMVPYVLKFQHIPGHENKKYKMFKRGAIYEPYFYSKLEHPNILRMFEHYQWQDWRIQLFELIPYGTFTSLIKFKENKKNITDDWLSMKLFDWQKFLRFYTAQILMALEYLHALDIIHFDLKPPNIGIGYRGYVKIFDFGVSQPATSMRSQFDAGIDLGVYNCKEKRTALLKMASAGIDKVEEALSKIGTESDIFAFNIVLLQLLGTFESKKYLDMYIDGDELNKKFQMANKSKNEYVKALIEYHELCQERIKAYRDSILVHLHQYPQLVRVIEESFHFDDYQNRKSANQLLKFEFYSDKYINKTKLFNQSYNLEAELNIDLKELFVKNYFNKCEVKDLGKCYSKPKNWKLLYEV